MLVQAGLVVNLKKSELATPTDLQVECVEVERHSLQDKGFQKRLSELSSLPQETQLEQYLRENGELLAGAAKRVRIPLTHF